jgi:hypothetical protein
MMLIKRIDAPAGVLPADCVGMFQTVLVWGKGVSRAPVVAAQLVDGGRSLDLVIEYEAPATVVPDDVCARVGMCRFDTHCASFVPCARRGVERHA